ncbi:hypothetical protein AB1Y20_011247 [Prymnesium parvum]|uniref:ADP-ribosylation factor-like protein 6-interacting protein 4 n=1 Tax=Prymnesium parvum TaxID=97485 RepID=A0AB34IP09_PRYPA
MGSGSDSESSSSSSSSEEERRKREKKEKKRKREKESKREKKHRKKEKKEKKPQKEKKHQKHKHEKKGKNTELLETATMAKWGAYGIIKESDMHLKQEEFYAWLAEVKGVSQEMLGRRDLAEYFSSYVEDYNTATLPSEKYYNMRKWYLEEQARIAREGASAAKKAAATFERASFDDETERRLERRRAAEKKNEHVAKLMAQNMSADSSLVADMRQQQDDARKMRHLMATGNTEEAREMIKKLDPNHVTEEQDSLRAVWGSGAGPAKKARKPQKS